MRNPKTCCYYLALGFLLVGIPMQGKSTKSQFEQERAILLQRIKSVKQILHQKEAKKKISVGQLTAINEQIATNHLLLQSLNKELEAINKQLDQQLQAIVSLSKELAQLKKEYATMLYLGVQHMHDIHILTFIFSATSFQALVQRLSAIKQYAKLRQKHLQAIKKIQSALHTQRITLEQRRFNKASLLQKWRKEQTKLTGLKQQQITMIATLEQQGTQLTQELNQQNAAIKNLDKLITDIVKGEIEAAQRLAKEKTAKLVARPGKAPTAKKLTEGFTRNRGKLPWPVSTGFISSHFGIHTHAVLRNIQVENLGIDIQTQEDSPVQAIFEGTVKTIAFVPGMHQVIIIQHGAYHTVYARLKSTSVKVGQYVQAQEPIGIMYTNKNGITELQLQIWKGIQKLNPAGWLAK